MHYELRKCYSFHSAEIGVHLFDLDHIHMVLDSFDDDVYVTLYLCLDREGFKGEAFQGEGEEQAKRQGSCEFSRRLFYRSIKQFACD
jgi:hypothetical protein